MREWVLGLLWLVSSCVSAPPHVEGTLPTQEQMQEAMDFAAMVTGLHPALLPPVHLASSEWMATRAKPKVGYHIVGLYSYGCRCIYLHPKWDGRVLVHEMTHYLEHMAGRMPSHELTPKVERAWMRSKSW